MAVMPLYKRFLILFLMLIPILGVSMAIVNANTLGTTTSGFAGSTPIWNAALANSHSKLAHVVVIGDSISQGFGTDPESEGYVGQVQTALQEKYGDGGSGFQGVVNSPAAQFPNLPTYISQTGTWSSLKEVAGIPGGVAVYTTGTANHTMTWPAVHGSTINVWYLPNTAESFYVSIDGATPTLQPANACSGVIYCAAIFSVSAGSHTVIMSGSGLFFLVGVSGFNPTGVAVSNLSLYGQSAGPYFTGYPGAAPDANADMMSPNLVILALGVNDASSPTETNDQFIAAFQTLVTAAKNSGADVLVFIQSGSGYDSAHLAKYLQYEADELTITVTSHLALFDPWMLQGRDPCWYYNQARTSGTPYGMVDAVVPGVGQCGMPSSYPDIHPNVLGHTWLAMQLIPYLEGN